MAENKNLSAFCREIITQDAEARSTLVPRRTGVSLAQFPLHDVTCNGEHVVTTTDLGTSPTMTNVRSRAFAGSTSWVHAPRSDVIIIAC